MKNYIFSILMSILFLAACQPKKVEPVSVGKVWKPVSVKENGTLVYQDGAATNARPGYSRFRLDLTSSEQVIFTDIDGRKTMGTWSLSTDNQRLILENLSPPPSETIGNIEFYINVPPTNNKLSLKRTAESRKTGNSVNEYELIPE
ncbi:hypothetical protein ACFP1I_07620 [Dyadobacter subterraneus]|uniref:Lipocalin-like domain-containing protein n=1 Tax=Dyadobacter subterraneus TaxID=2773304 RepID=A0ABR9WF26_9BACT|nr:hypothetical protein [Dyadobacter subterraneus]MBE9463998.1 hypothetical protein [Dyadobacter subterraneus]